MAKPEQAFSIKDHILIAKGPANMARSYMEETARCLGYLYFEHHGKVYRVVNNPKMVPIELAVSYGELMKAEPVIIKINSGE